jgi:hypothetical protein
MPFLVRPYNRSRLVFASTAGVAGAALLIAAWLLSKPADPRKAVVGHWSGKHVTGYPSGLYPPEFDVFDDGTLVTNLLDWIQPPDERSGMKTVHSPDGRTVTFFWAPPGKHTSGTWRLNDDKTIKATLTVPSTGMEVVAIIGVATEDGERTLNVYWEDNTRIMSGWVAKD